MSAEGGEKKKRRLGNKLRLVVERNEVVLVRLALAVVVDCGGALVCILCSCERWRKWENSGQVKKRKRTKEWMLQTPRTSVARSSTPRQRTADFIKEKGE